MTHFPAEGKRTLHLASPSPEPMGGTAWNRAVCTLIVPTMSREYGRSFHSQERPLGRHLEAAPHFGEEVLTRHFAFTIATACLTSVSRRAEGAGYPLAYAGTYDGLLGGKRVWREQTPAFPQPADCLASYRLVDVT